MRFGVRFRLLCIAAAAWLAVQGVPAFAQQANAMSGFPNAEATLKYLNQTIDWYRHVAAEEQFARDSSDVMFLNDDRQVSEQILRLSFDFARAEAQLL